MLDEHHQPYYLMIRIIAAGDRKLMSQLNQWLAPRWVRTWMVWASRAGDGWLWVGIGLALLVFGGAQRFDALEAGFISVGAGIVTFQVLKRVTGRTRPSGLETHRWASLLPPDRFSFPSGHTITAFCVAVPLGLFYPALLVGLVFCAMSVAASRVLLGLHYLTDVLAGIVIGSGLGVAAFWWSAG